jgi:hypothetical protein
MQTVEPPERTRAETGAEARTLAAPAVRRHRVYAGLAVATVLAVLVLVPVLPAPAPTRSTSTGVVEPPSVTPPTPAYGVGLTVAGRRCGPGRRQVAWSVYAPPCQPAWHGNNGGDTSLGVTSHTIGVAFRVAPVSQMKLLYPLLPAAAIGTPAEQVATVTRVPATWSTWARPATSATRRRSGPRSTCSPTCPCSTRPRRTLTTWPPSTW